MTRIILLERLRDFSRLATGDIIMPVKPQKADQKPAGRAADVYLMRLPDSGAAQRKAPYIIHQFINGKDQQTPGERGSSVAVVRSIFCVFNDNEEEGALMLLNLMERLRVALLRKGVIGERFTLDLGAGLEALAYPDDTAPFYAGEIVSTWILPAVEREVDFT